MSTAISRTTNCEECGTPTSYERTDPKTQPPEGEVCEQCGTWVCTDCSHPIGEPCKRPNEPQPATVEGEGAETIARQAKIAEAIFDEIIRDEQDAQPTTPHTAGDEPDLAWAFPLYYENIVGHHCVFDADGNQTFTVESEAQGRYVVQAVNSFDARDMALRQAQTIIRDHVNGVERTAWPEVLAAIDAALKLAGKGE